MIIAPATSGMSASSCAAASTSRLVASWPCMVAADEARLLHREELRERHRLPIAGDQHDRPARPQQLDRPLDRARGAGASTTTSYSPAGSTPPPIRRHRVALRRMPGIDVDGAAPPLGPRDRAQPDRAGTDDRDPVAVPVMPARRSACSEHDTGSTSAASATSSAPGSGHDARLPDHQLVGHPAVASHAQGAADRLSALAVLAAPGSDRTHRTEPVATARPASRRRDGPRARGRS